MGKKEAGARKWIRANAGQTWNQWWPNLLARTYQEEAEMILSHQNVLAIPCQTFLSGKTNRKLTDLMSSQEPSAQRYQHGMTEADLPTLSQTLSSLGLEPLSEIGQRRSDCQEPESEGLDRL